MKYIGVYHTPAQVGETDYVNSYDTIVGFIELSGNHDPAVICNEISDQVAQLREVFDHFDHNHDVDIFDMAQGVFISARFDNGNFIPIVSLLPLIWSADRDSHFDFTKALEEKGLA